MQTTSSIAKSDENTCNQSQLEIYNNLIIPFK